MGLLVSLLRSIARLLTASGWSALTAGAALSALGLIWNHNETLLIGATLLGVVVAAVVWMVRRPQLSVTRMPDPARVEEGEPAWAVVRLTNLTGRRSPWVTVVDQLDGRPVSFAVAPVPGDGEREDGYALPTDRRGVHRLGPLAVSYVDPFRLVRAGSGSGGRATYRVWPATVPVPPLPTGRIRDVDGSTTPQISGSGITFHSLREYVPGDELRQIHWRSSARTGSLLVRQNVLTSEPRMVLFVDCRADAYDSEARFDEVCRVAASLLRAGVRGANPVEVLASSGGRAQVAGNGSGFDEAMDLLAGLEPAAGDPGPVQLARLASRRHGVASVAVLTGDVAPAHAELLRALRSRFATFHAVQIGNPASLQVLPLPATALVVASELADFAEQWSRRVGR